MPLIVPFAGATPSVPASAWVAPNATLVGRVILGERSSVYYGTVLRADIASITLGERSNLQDNVTVHVEPSSPVVVGTGVSVGHGAVLHGCTIGDDCLIGMSATVLNGAVIGAGTLVAAGAVVLEDSVIPPGSLVAGVPAKVRRALTAEEQAELRANGERYLGYTEEHRAANA